MKRFIESDDRMQGTLFPEYLEDYVAEDNPIPVVDVFVENLDFGKLGFNRTEPTITGEPPYLMPYKVKAVNNRDRNFTENKVKRRREQIETSIGRY
jgi:hypothetical protein